jgi:DNA polymerase-1
MLASYVLNPEQSHNLKSLSRQYLSNIEPKSYQDLGISKGQTIASLDIAIVAEYCGLDAYATLAIFSNLQQQLENLPELNKLLLEVEQPLEPILAAMEYRGVRLDTSYLQQLSQQVDSELATIQKQAYQLAEKEFNLDSPRQLEVILFDDLGLDRRKSRKTKTGYSTDHSTLEKLQGDHPIIDQILSYRTLAKLKSTYVDALPLLVRKDTQRIHTSFNQTITSTGRLSSSNPNLQNIPIRTAFSRQIRRAFIPETDWLLVTADYSQIELRILAHLSQETLLVEAYQQNQDVHTLTAQILLEKTEISREERRLGKIINFGVIYGMGAQKFAREAGVTASEGKSFIDKYRQRYPRIFAYLESVKQQAIASGYVTTILGRRRYFNFSSEGLQKLRGTNPESINLSNLNINYADNQLLRSAANAPIQGSSADIIKMAMINLQKILNNYQGRLLLQVHDELVLEMPPQEWEELQQQIKSTMENVLKLSIPLVIEIHQGNNWMEAK